MSDEISPANTNTPGDEPLQLDSLLRDFYAREMQQGLPWRTGAGTGTAVRPPVRVTPVPGLVQYGAATETGAKRGGGTAAVLTAACALLVLATLLLQYSRRGAGTVATAARGSAGTEEGAGSAASAVEGRSPGAVALVHDAALSRREPVERSGRPRVDARTDGVPVLHGENESPSRPGLEIHVPDEAIEIFPIDEGRRPVVAPRPATARQR